MAGRVKKAGAPKKKANGYKMPAPIEPGEVIHDTLAKKKWRIGPSIGVGGFGEIYSACNHDGSPKKASSYPFVVKIEPHENGPLFVEKHFYIRNTNMNDIKEFMKSKKLSSLGMPSYYGNGTHDYKGEKYRYLVLERYGKDVWTLFNEAGRTFPAATVFQLGLQMLDVLEYIHNRGYVHADIKGANILMGLKKGTENQAYLVDFGLATRLNEREFKPDPKCAHNGTIEYTSRDAHLGVPTMRGDLEILGYNMLQWLASELPWEQSLTQPKTVQAMKEEFMKNLRSTITKDYPNVPEELIKFLEYVNSLKPKDTPDYTKCRKLFEGFLKKDGKTITSDMVFTPSKNTKTKRPIDNGESHGGKKKASKQNGGASKAKRTKKTKVPEDSQDEEQDGSQDEEHDEDDGEKKPTKLNGEVPKVRRGRPPKVRRGRKPQTRPELRDESRDDEEVDDENDGKKKPSESNGMNKSPDDSHKEGSQTKKRKSSEPVLLVNLKRICLTPKVTPPIKKNHVNIATQTSLEKVRNPPRQVSFDSPICEVIRDNKSQDSTVNSSGDIFEDSFVIEEKKVKPKRKLLSEEKVTIKRVVRKKVTKVEKAAKGRSWKDAPSVQNGRSPPK